MVLYSDWAAIVPAANKAESFDEFTAVMKKGLDRVGSGKSCFMVGKAAKDTVLPHFRKHLALHPVGL